MERSNIRASEAGLKTLADFANTGDSLRDWRVFFRNHPDFVSQEVAERISAWPYEGQESSCEGYDYLVVTRNQLREVWKGQDLDGEILAEILEVRLGDPTRVFPGEWPPYPRLKLNWQKGVIEYQAAGSNFHESLWYLFQNSWRAKVCPQCGSYFVARRPPQRFCSTDCRDIVTRQVKLAYYREVGKERRQKRNKARRKKRQAGKTSKRR